MKYTKAKLYTNGNLKGIWNVSYKIDGVRAIVTPDGVFSRNEKPLYNLDFLIPKAPLDAEIFAGSWEKTITCVRTKLSDPVPMEFVYELSPNIDERLVIGELNNPTENDINDLLKKACSKGYEGLILRQGNKWLKVKPTETFDVPITKIIEGTGKYTGMLGAFETSMGNVGTGFNDNQRKEYFDESLVGKIIEVECMELTPDKKFRHPRFKRIRWDKSK